MIRREGEITDRRYQISMLTIYRGSLDIYYAYRTTAGYEAVLLLVTA